MESIHRTLVIIPARAGSKGIPGKNIRPLAGKPLVTWTVHQALKCLHPNRVIVSTDGDEIAEIARQAGAEVPFLRPEQFSRDESPLSDVVLHALDYFEGVGEQFSFVAVLEPTSPLRRPSDLDHAIERLTSESQADSLVTVGEVHTEHPLIVKKMANGRVVPYLEKGGLIYQRQQADAAFFPYGVVYLARIEKYRALHSFYSEHTCGLPLERWQNFEIDDELDFRIVEQVINLHAADVE